MFKIYSIIIDVAPIKKLEKGECIYILNKRIKYYTKEMCKLMSILLVSSLIVITVLLVKYKPAFKVNIAGEELGYVNNKNDIESAIDAYINDKQGCVADIYVAERPDYEFIFIDNAVTTSEEEILLKIKDDSVITYRMFAIKLNGETKDYVESLEEAENVVASMKEQYSKEIEVDMTIEELYTQESIEVVNIEMATAKINEELSAKVQAKKEAEAKAAAAKKAASRSSTSRTTTSSKKVDLGITLIKPISGTITSKFGANSSRRSGSHTGLDIAAPKGTNIKAAASGTVTFSGTKGSYGKMVIISHGDGVETYYAHCSKLNVSVGYKVSQGQVIAEVGSTGNSTGNHLHLEIRKNGTILNPQHYVY